MAVCSEIHTKHTNTEKTNLYHVLFMLVCFGLAAVLPGAGGAMIYTFS